MERLPKLDYCEKTDLFVPGGLAPVKNIADVWGEDYASAIDSTMARFWWLGKGEKVNERVKVEEKVKAVLADFPGHWLTEEEMKRHGIWREDRKFGDAIFLADAGVQFAPSDMGVKPLNGMHGFDPDDEDSLACWLSTVPVPESVSRVCDYFGIMTR